MRSEERKDNFGIEAEGQARLWDSGLYSRFWGQWTVQSRRDLWEIIGLRIFTLCKSQGGGLRGSRLHFARELNLRIRGFLLFWDADSHSSVVWTVLCSRRSVRI